MREAIAFQIGRVNSLKYIGLILVILFCNSCYSGRIHTIYTETVDVSSLYEVKSIVSCCGCRAILFDVRKQNRIVEQFIVETDCGLFEPTKHLFLFDIKGNVIGVESFVAVSDSSFEFPVKELEKLVFKQLDSIYSTWNSSIKRAIVFSSITGYKAGQSPHMAVGVKIKKGPVF